MKSSALPEEIDYFAQRHALRPGGIVVALSGGPDSVALFRALLTAKWTAGSRLILAHLNHQLRGSESDKDEQFVRAHFCEFSVQRERDMALHIECKDVAARALEQGKNLEEMARHLRYEWLADIAKREHAPYVATGHTLDDQAETVLHRLIRGTGIRGLRGIAPRRPLADGVVVIRPLLTVSRRDILAYLKELGQSYRVDQSNADLSFTRNRIRHELLPLLAEHYNRAIVPVLGRMAESAAEAYRDLERQVSELLAAVEKPRAGSAIVLDAARLAQAPRHLVREMFRFLWLREHWPEGSMDFAAWERLADLTTGTINSVDLPGNVRAQRRERVILVSRTH